MRRAIESYGYKEIATPTFEHSDLFIARSGPQILDQVYDFEDKGGRRLVLRPELTAPVMRFFASDLRNLPKPLRIYYFGNCFRYERPQKGRYREFWQMGLEYIGKRTAMANAEVIGAAISAIEGAGLGNFEVRIGHVSLLSSMLSHWGIGKDNKDLMILIDKKDREAISKTLGDDETSERVSSLISRTYGPEEAEEALSQLSSSIPDLDGNAIEELSTVLGILGDGQGKVMMDLSITRGLDYYDGVVFEIDTPSLGAEKQICGGGAYSLSEVLGKEVEGIGFGLGFDRIIVAMGNGVKIEDEAPFVYLLPMGAKAEKASFSIARTIRESGTGCMVETSGRNFKRSLSQAVESSCSHLIIVGDRELEKGVVSVKDLETKEQREYPISKLKEISSFLG
jgi:histidyl-tRNA synthetase